jgi:hypothetical protein
MAEQAGGDPNVLVPNSMAILNEQQRIRNLTARQTRLQGLPTPTPQQQRRLGRVQTALTGSQAKLQQRLTKNPLGSY